MGLTMRIVLTTFSVLMAAATLAACSTDFQWDDLRTWRPESNHQRYVRELEESCGEFANREENQRVVAVNGVDEYYYHTDCQPQTSTPPQYMNRMEGR